MSNGLAIAAVTRTLQTLLVGATANVSMRPPDKAREGAAAEEQLNLFLYNTPVAAAFRNSDPTGLRSGESGIPPLPLALHYLITAYGPDEATAHGVLGKAMLILHDHTQLSPQDILDANQDADPSGVDSQVERVKITPLPLSPHDMFELWSGFATNYRISAAYEASVVLIDSTRERRTPLPVLQRAPAAITGGEPVADAVLPPDRATVATLGATVSIVGSKLLSVTAIKFKHPLWKKPQLLVPTTVADQECRIELPGLATAIATWPAGVYKVQAISDRHGVPRLDSEVVPMPLGPTITVTSPTTPVPEGEVDVIVECRPRIKPDQAVSMLLDSAEAVETTFTTPGDEDEPTTVTGKFTKVGEGTHTVRLRVDLVDSDSVRYTGSPPIPEFDPAVQVVVT